MANLLNSRFVRWVEKETPNILTGFAIGGVFTTGGLAIKATPIALHILDEYRPMKRDDEPIPPMEVVRLVWRCYVPTVGSALLTVGCILASNKSWARRNAALAGAYALGQEALKEYQEKVIEVIGKNKEEKVRDLIAQERLNSNPVEDREVVITGKGEVLFFDSLSGRYFKSDIEAVRRWINEFNHDLLSDMFKTLNELYEGLHLAPIDMGKDLGWDIEDGLLEIYFSSKITTTGIPCIVLSYSVGPKKM